MLLLLPALVRPACGGSSDSGVTDASAESGEPVRFEAADGVELVGRAFGDGPVGVILAHMGREGDTQADFDTLARALADRGYLALTYFSPEQLQELEGAKLFVSSAEDIYGGADAAREWYGWANEPKRLEILPGSEHGTDMLRKGEPTARPLVKLVLRFLMGTVPPRGEEPR